MMRHRATLPALLIMIPILVVALTLAQAEQKAGPQEYFGPKHDLAAVVIAVGKVKGFESHESRVEIRDKSGKPICAHDFSSEDGEHGYGVATAQWTPDGQFFVFAMSNSGGHSPMFAPVVYWSHASNRFYELRDYPADQVFSVSAPDKVTVATYPGLREVVLSLHAINESEAKALH